MALTETPHLLEDILDYTPLPVACLDAQFNFIRVNRAYADMKEREPVFFPGRNHFTLYPNAEEKAIFRRVVETGQPYFAYARPFEAAERPQGEVSYWDWSLTPVKNPDGAVMALVLTMTNVTESQRARQVLQASMVEQKRAYEQAIIYARELSAEIGERRRAEEALIRRAEEMAALYQTSLEINDQPDLSTLLQVIVHRATTLLGTNQGGLFLLKPDSQSLEVVAAHNQGDFLGDTLHLGEGVAGRVAQTGEPLMIADYHSWPGRLARRKLASTGRVLGVPLKQREQVIGVLTVLDEGTGEFKPDDIRLLSLFANQAALAIERARLFDETQIQLQRLALLNHLARQMTGVLEIRELCTLVAQHLHSAFQYFNVAIFTVDSTSQQLVAQVNVGVSAHLVQPGKYRQAFGVGIIGQAAITGQPVVVNDTRQYPGFFELEEMTIYAELAVPLKVGEQLIGVLNVDSDQPNTFDDKDVTLLATIGDQLAIALEKIRLFEATRHNQERYRHLFDNSPISIWEQDYAAVKIYLDRLSEAGVTDLAIYFEQRPEEVRRCARLVKIGEANQASLALYQAQTKEALLTGLDPFFSQETYAAFRDMLVVMAAGQTTYECETVNQTLAGDKVNIWLRLSIAPGYEVTWSKVLISIMDITALKQAEAQVRRQRQELRRLSSQLINTQEAERKRLAHELHDEMGQALTAIGINLERIEQELPLSFSPTVRKRLADAISLVDQTLAQTRELSLNLRPSMLDDLGLEATLSWYVKRYAARGNLEVELDTWDFGQRLRVEVETALYRVVQEALTNVARHAQAQRVYLRLAHQDATVTVLIEDNGRGFDVQEVTNRRAAELGLGLIGMRERVTTLGGRLDVQSQPGRGTRLFIEIPLGWAGES